jgi:hypothetical protein
LNDLRCPSSVSAKVPSTSKIMALMFINVS